MAPMSRPLRRVSPAMAPTRSWGRIPEPRPAPMNNFAIGPDPPRAGRPWPPPAPGEPPVRPRVAVASGRHRGFRDLLLVGGGRARRLVGQFDGRQGDLHEIEVVGQGLDHDAEGVEVVFEEALVNGGTRQLEPPGAEVGHRGDLFDLDALTRHPLDRLEHPVLAGLGQRDGDPLATSATHPSDAVDIGVGGRRDVVVDDVGELFDVEAAGCDIGGHQQVGGAGPEPAHDAVALLLGHATVQAFGPVAAAVEGVGERVDLVASPAEHDGGRRGLDVEDAPERSRLVRPGHDVGPLTNEGCFTWGGAGLADLDADGVA